MRLFYEPQITEQPFRAHGFRFRRNQETLVLGGLAFGALVLRNGSSNNRGNQEWPIHRDGRSGIDRRGWKQIPCRKTNGTLSLRRFHRETVLRRHALEDRISSRSESCAAIKGMTDV